MIFPKNLFIGLVLLLVGGLAGRFLTVQLYYHCLRTYPFLSGNICVKEPAIDKKGYGQLKGQLEHYFADQLAEGVFSNVAVYFRDLNNGPTFGINDNEEFIPASLMKLPLLMTYLEWNETDPNILKRQLIYEAGSSEQEQTFKPATQIQEKTPYTIDELLSRMIIYSDNRAYYMLFDYQNQLSPTSPPLLATLKRIGLVWGEDSYQSVLSARDYAGVFRLLFNASYLTPENSDKALSLLVQSQFIDGLTAGLPAEVKVAHKFGERVGLTGGESQLHDCGIIYYPHNPYLLCVMTRGQKMPELAKVISRVSELVYEEVRSRD